MGTTGTWCRFYDGGDIGAIVRGSGGTLLCGNPFEDTVSLTHLFDNSGSSSYDDAFIRSEISVEHKPTSFSATANSTASSQKKRPGCENFLPFNLTNTKHDPDSAENVCSTASSPRASEYQKSPPRSPIRESTALDNSSSKEVTKARCTSSAIKTEANDQSPIKMCSSPKVPGTKRRKSQQRSVVCIPMAEGSWNKQGGAGVASDLWSWRKYGQKPIKGSPYPRGYYRCSSSKGCPARKQVERSRTDPTMLVITYTADHNHASPAHRRALARSSGQNSLHDKKEQQPLSLSVPHTSDAATATDNHDALSPPDGSAQQERGPNSECVDNSLDGTDQYLSANHMLHDDLFASFGEFPDIFHRDFANRSDEEDDCTMVDPFNLFDWSFSSNEWPNS